MISTPPEGTPALESAVDAATYLVGPGDRLLIGLWGVQEQSTEVLVNPEGRIYIPRVGVFNVQGQTLGLLRKTIESALRLVYPNLHANVTLVRPRTFLVNVVGAVSRPGSYIATPLSRVSGLIPRAAPLANASTRTIELRRRGETKRVVADLVRFTMLGDATADPTLLDGDTLYVPLRELEVEVSGAVKRPGRYELVGSRNIRELLDLAGGLDSTAARSLPIRLTTRVEGDRLGVRSLPQSEAPATSLHAGDRVHVPALVDLQRTVVVEGAIQTNPSSSAVGAARTPAGDPEHPSNATERPGELAALASREASFTLPFVDGDGVRDLITKVGGLQPWADGSAAYLLRPQSDGQRARIPVDVLAISAGRAPEMRVMTGDTLVIPSRRDAVVVGGAVQHPGLYPYSRDLHPIDYLTLAGGVTRTGLAGSARVLRRNGNSRPIKDVNTIEPGDVISVPEARISAAEWVEITLILANLAVGTAALIVTLERR